MMDWACSRLELDCIGHVCVADETIQISIYENFWCTQYKTSINDSSTIPIALDQDVSLSIFNSE